MNPVTTSRTTDLLRISDLDAAGLDELLQLSEQMKWRPDGWFDTLRAQTVACYFAKPSTRTRASFETAIARLGGVPMMLRPDELQLGRGEPISDTARVLASYSAAIVIRTFADSDVAEVAAAADVPVVNALTDQHHPCQALADLLTLREHFGRLEGLKVVYVGDGNNVAHSLMEAGHLAGVEVVVACPEGYEPDPEITAASGATIAHDPIDAVAGAHAVYTDVWVSMGQDAEKATRLADLRRYQVDPTMMAHARPDAIFLHCLPAHRGLEVAEEVIDGPQSLVFAQAANRLPTEQAVLHTLVTRNREA